MLKGVHSNDDYNDDDDDDNDGRDNDIIQVFGKNFMKFYFEHNKLRKLLYDLILNISFVLINFVIISLT